MVVHGPNTSCQVYHLATRVVPSLFYVAQLCYRESGIAGKNLNILEQCLCSSRFSEIVCSLLWYLTFDAFLCMQSSAQALKKKPGTLFEEF
jgi:hypothetical protein